MNIKVGPCLAEFFGTFTLCFIGAGSIIINQIEPIGLLGIAAAHGLALAIAVTATMNVSGGHINPAISLGLLLIGKCKPLDAFSYIVYQMLGAAFAGLLLFLFFPHTAAVAAAYGTPALGAGTSAGAGLVLEIVATFLLAMAVYGTAVSSKAPKVVAGFGIGLTVMFLILAIGPLTGAAMNPARHFGSALFSGQIGYQWLYWLGPVIGSALAFQVFSLAFEEEKQD